MERSISIGWMATARTLWTFIDRFCEAEEERKELH
jgi:hypothetical protein